MLLTFGLFILFASHQVQAQETLNQARLRPPGSVVTIRGIVLNGSELGPIRYIQDTTAGIAAYPGGNSPAGFEQLTRADEVQVTGVLSVFHGLLEINPILSYQKLSSNNALPQPQSIPLDKLTTDDQGILIRIPCAHFVRVPGTFEAGNHAIYSTEGVRSHIYLEGNHPMINTGMPETTVDMVAIVSHYDRPRLLIRSAEDIMQAQCFHILPTPAQSSITPDGFMVTWSTDRTATGFCSITSETGVTEILETDDPGVIHTMTFMDLDPAKFYRVKVGAVDIKGDTALYPQTPMSTMSLSSGEISVYFNQSVNTAFSNGASPAGTSFNAMMSSITQLITNAQQTIDVAMYNSNRPDIIFALEQAMQRGVRVRYIGDGGQSNSALSPPPDFPVFFRNGDGIMHHKFIIADPHDPDHAIIWTGSTNHSTNQLATDPNNAIVIRDQALARAYLHEFEEMWGGDGSMPNSLMSRTGSAKLDDTPHMFQVGDILIENYFSPSDYTNREILTELESANTSVDVALLLLTRSDLTSAMANKKAMGLRVRLIVDDLESSAFQVQSLLGAGVRVEHHDFNSIFHHKYGILDEGADQSRVITGSHNWTTSATVRNDENTLIIHDTDITNIYRQEFEARWAELSPTAIKTHPLESRIQIYPNPVFEILNFVPRDEDVHITISTMNGMSVRTDRLSSSQLDLSSLQPGMYLLTIANKNGSQGRMTFIKL